MMTNEEKLEPCPFCGGEPSIEEIEAHQHAFAKFMPDCPGYFYVECAPCDARRFGNTRQEAIAAWNTRHFSAIEEKYQAQIAMLRDALTILVNNTRLGCSPAFIEKLCKQSDKALSATKQSSDAFIAEIEAMAVEQAMALLFTHGEDHNWRIMSKNMGNSWSEFRKQAEQHQTKRKPCTCDGWCDGLCLEQGKQT